MLKKDKIEYNITNFYTIEKMLNMYNYTLASKKKILSYLYYKPEPLLEKYIFPETNRLWFKITPQMRMLLRQQTTNKAVSETKYLVISRNPVDFMMCSTGQGFHSCYALDSRSSNAWSLPSLLCDKNRFLIYLTNAKFKNFVLDDEGDMKFRYLKIKARCWGLLTNKDILFLNKDYSESSVDLQPLLNELSIPSTHYIDALSKYPLDFPRGKSKKEYIKGSIIELEKGNFAVFPILDNGIKFVHYKRKVYYGFGVINKRSFEPSRLSNSKSFLQLVSTRDKCSHCKKIYKIEKMERTEDGLFCPTCTKNFIRKCKTCGRKFFEPSNDKVVNCCYHCGTQYQIKVIENLSTGTIVRVQLDPNYRGIWGDERLIDFNRSTAYHIQDKTSYMLSKTTETANILSTFGTDYPYVRDYFIEEDENGLKHFYSWDYKYEENTNTVEVRVLAHRIYNRTYTDADFEKPLPEIRPKPEFQLMVI